jgi:hypothetical protein
LQTEWHKSDRVWEKNQGGGMGIYLVEELDSHILASLFGNDFSGKEIHSKTKERTNERVNIQ